MPKIRNQFHSDTIITRLNKVFDQKLEDKTHLSMVKMGMQAFFANELDRFDKRLYTIADFKEDKIISRLNELKKPGILRSELDSIIAEIPAFFNGIQIYNTPNSPLFQHTTKNWYLTTTDAFPLTMSKRLEAEGGISLIDVFCGAYSKDELFIYFQSLQRILEIESKKNPRISLLLRNVKNSINISYDASKTPPWALIDGEHLPTEYVKTSNISAKVFNALSKDDVAIFSTEFFSLTKDKENINKIVDRWQHEVSWKQIHLPKSQREKAQWLDSNGNSLLYQAVKIDNTRLVEQLLEAKANPNQALKKDGLTPFHAAILNENQPILDQLLTAHADPNLETGDGWSPLSTAVFKGNHEIIQKLIGSKANVNQIGKTGLTALNVAVDNGYFECVKRLLAAGANINQGCYIDCYPIYSAAKNGHLDILKWLLKEDTYKGSVTHLKNGTTPLMVASEMNQYEVCQVLLENKVNLDSININQTTALMFAAYKGHSKIADLLMDAKSDVNKTDHLGQTSLYKAAEGGHLKVIEALLNSSADPNKSTKDGLTPLCIAMLNGHTEIAKRLIRANTNPNLSKPLFIAAQSGQVELAALLIDAKADINQKYNDRTTLSIAVQQKQVEMVKLLIKAGANKSWLAHSNGDMTPLMFAASNGSSEIIKILLDEGVELDYQCNPTDETALYFASANGHIDIVNALLAARANINLSDNDGVTPLKAAIKNNHPDIVKILLESKADPHVRYSYIDTLLSYAIKNDQTKIVELLKSANVSAVPRDQLFIISPMKKISLHPDDDGICFGLAAIAMQMFLSGDIKTLNYLIEMLASIKDDRFKEEFERLIQKRVQLIKTIKQEICDEIKTIRIHPDQLWNYHLTASNLHLSEEDFNKLTKQEKETRNEAFRADLREKINAKIAQYLEKNEEERLRFELLALLEGIDIYFQPQRYKDLFEKGKIPKTQDIIQVIPLLVAKKSEINPPLELESFFGLYNKEELGAYFNSFVKCYASMAKEKSIKMSFILKNADHAITIGFNPEQSLPWTFINANQLPAQFLESKDMANAVLHAFNEKKISCFRTKVYANKRDETIVKSIIQVWKEQDEWDKIHRRTIIDKATLVDAHGAMLLSFAASDGNVALVQQLVAAKAPINQTNINGFSPLCSAATNGHIETVKTLIDSKANVNLSTKDHFSPLHMVAQNNYPDVAEELIKAKAEVNAQSDRGYTPIITAASHGNEEVIQILLKHQASLNLRDNTGATPLLYAAFNKNHTIVAKQLIEAKANLNLSNNKYSTPLIAAISQGNALLVDTLLGFKANISNDSLSFAIQYGHLEIVKSLINVGANLSDLARNIDGNTPLILATKYNCPAILKVLLEAGADPNLKNGNRSPLDYAALFNHPDIAKELIEAKAEINNSDDEGLTPVTIAAASGNKETIETLLEYKASVDLRDNKGNTPLLQAMVKNHTGVVKQLIEAKANPNLSNNTYRTPLITAILKGNVLLVNSLLENKANISNHSLLFAIAVGHLEIVNSLIKAGANISDLARNNDNGNTPLMLAVKYNHPDILKVLLEASADPNLRNNYGSTALFMAINFNNIEMVKSLLHAKADPSCMNNTTASAIHIAANEGQLEIVKALFEAKSNTNQTYGENITALYLAVQNNHFDVVVTLLEAKADPNVLVGGKNVALHLAIIRSQTEMAKLLLEAKANPNLETINKETSLMIAVQDGNVKMVELLLEYGVDPNQQLKDGTTLTDFAISKGQEELVKLLLKYHASVSPKAKLKMSPNMYKFWHSSLKSKTDDVGSEQQINLTDLSDSNKKLLLTKIDMLGLLKK